jgi:hypothetical protein
MTISCQVTDEGLQALAGCKRLRYLQIASPYVTQKGLSRLAEKLPTLQQTNLYSYYLEGWPVMSTERDKFLRKGSRDARPKLDAMEGRLPPKLFCTRWYNLEAAEVELADLRGRVVIVDFCSTASGNDANQINVVKELLEKHHEAGLEIVSVHTTKDAESAEMYTGEFLISWPLGLDDSDKSKEAWHVDRYPAYYLIDRTGQLRIADIYPKQLEEAVKMLLEQE